MRYARLTPPSLAMIEHPLSPAGISRGSAALLPWTVTSEELVLPSSTGSSGPAPPPPPLSLNERVSAPLIFIHQALVFASALDAGRLRQALASALALFPTLACRAAKDEVCAGGGRRFTLLRCLLLLHCFFLLRCFRTRSPPHPHRACRPCAHTARRPRPRARPQGGEWALCQPGAGALLTLGSSSAATRRAAPCPPLPPAAPLAALGEELFGHLPGLPADGAGAPALPLTHLALVSTLDGGCVLGLRVSHLVADFGTLRGFLHHLAREYSGTPLAPADRPVMGQPLMAALCAAPPPPGARLHNYLPAPPTFGEALAALAAQPPLQGLTLHVPPARLAALRAQAAAEAAGEAGAAGAAGEEGCVSTNAALMAWLWRTLAALPCRRGAVVSFFQALDVRRRLPEAALAACGASSDAPPRWVYGNLAASALTPALDVASMTLGSGAMELRRAVARRARGRHGRRRRGMGPARLPRMAHGAAVASDSSAGAPRPTHAQPLASARPTPLPLLPACRDAAHLPADMALLAAGSGAPGSAPAATSPPMLRGVLEIITQRAAGRPTLIMTSQVAPSIYCVGGRAAGGWKGKPRCERGLRAAALAALHRRLAPPCLAPTSPNPLALSPNSLRPSPPRCLHTNCRSWCWTTRRMLASAASCRWGRPARLAWW